MNKDELKETINRLTLNFNRLKELNKELILSLKRDNEILRKQHQLPNETTYTVKKKKKEE